MPRTEHPVDVWYNYTTGESLDRSRHRAQSRHPSEQKDPPLRDIVDGKWYAFRYKDSECDKTHHVPDEARFIIPRASRSAGGGAPPLEWYDKTTFTPEELRASFPVYPLEHTERLHELAPRHLFPPHRSWHPPPIPHLPASLSEYVAPWVTRITNRVEHMCDACSRPEWHGASASSLTNYVVFNLRQLLSELPPELRPMLPNTLWFLEKTERSGPNQHLRPSGLRERLAYYLQKDIALHTSDSFGLEVAHSSMAKP
jgi:hypothetical protein